jgi:O-antigen biosynthesis protein WbqP
MTPAHELKRAERYVIPGGCSMRQTSLDELPQLWNVLKGEMSLVGPRPALPNQVDLLAKRDKCGANALRPGLTGWAQINGRNEIPVMRKASYDGEYARNMSFLLDLKCVVGTLIGRGNPDGPHARVNRNA